MMYEEIERLTEENLKYSVDRGRILAEKDDLELRLKEQNAIIKQLEKDFATQRDKKVEWFKKANDVNDLNTKLHNKNIELQKQVDELKEERENMSNEIFNLEQEKEDLYFKNKGLQIYIDNHEPIWKRNTEQAVKDTAKEILQYVGDLCDDGDQRFRLKDYQWHKNLCKKFGVEVE